MIFRWCRNLFSFAGLKLKTHAMTFNEMINSDKPVLVDFSAEWCGPCKALAPILKEVKDEVKDTASIIKIDVDKNPQAAGVYQVSAVPTLIIFRQGKVLWRQSGVVPKNELVRKLKEFQ
jgi:thioredoxin 1